jgi:Leucine-rich repeat (LRR) protein
MKPIVLAVLSLVVALFLVDAAGQSAAAFAADGTAIGTDEFSCTNVTEIPKVECEALVALYDSTNGPGWTANTGWKVTDTPCGWFGVACNEGHVTSHALQSNLLSGAIPPELGNLTALCSLDLFANQLSGAIPPELGNLMSLNFLTLDYNQLSGAIPPELGNLANLMFLGLSSNQLSGAIPPQLGNLPSLNSLNLRHNQLSGALPQRLTNLKLVSFNFDNTSLCEPLYAAFQRWLAGIQNLMRTGILCDDCAKVTEVPKVECEALAALYYDANGGGWVNAGGWIVTATPCTWYGVSCDTGRVVSLSLPANQLSGTIPGEMGNLAKLQTLLLSSNALSGTLPYSLMTLSLNRFWFDGTALCEPANAAFQSWLAGIGDLRRTGVLCRMCYLPMVRCCAPWPGRPTMGMLDLQR